MIIISTTTYLIVFFMVAVSFLPKAAIVIYISFGYQFHATGIFWENPSCL